VGVYGAGAYDLSGSIYLLFGGIYPATLRSDSLHLQVFAYVTQELQNCHLTSAGSDASVA